MGSKEPNPHTLGSLVPFCSRVSISQLSTCHQSHSVRWGSLGPTWRLTGINGPNEHSDGFEEKWGGQKNFPWLSSIHMGSNPWQQRVSHKFQKRFVYWVTCLFVIHACPISCTLMHAVSSIQYWTETWIEGSSHLGTLGTESMLHCALCVYVYI